MTDDETFLLTLKETHRRSLAEMPVPEPARAGCPSLIRLAECLAKGWGKKELAHVQGCLHCQKIVAAEWRIECPDLGILARHLAGVLPFGEAMRIHLQSHSCQRCGRRLESPWLAGIASLLRAGTLAESKLEELQNRIVLSSVPLHVAPAFEPADGAPAFATIQSTSRDGSIEVTLRSEGAELCLYLNAFDAAQAGKTVTVELLGLNLRLKAQVALKLVNGIGAFGAHNFGKLSQLAAALGPSVEILAILNK
jgi:hypothetical protein